MNTLNSNKYIYLITSLLTLFFIGCSGVSTLNDGEKLYVGAKISIQADSLNKSDRKQLKEELETKLTPKPNSSILGMRPKLYFYKWAGETNKNKGFRHWVKTKLGEKPVLFSEVDPDFNRDLIVNHAENTGYFNAKARYEVKEKKKKAQLKYMVSPKKRYYIHEVSYLSNDEDIASEIQNTSKESLLKTGNPFDLETIKKERTRIDGYMKENGYYYFNADNLTIQVDSTQESQRVKLNIALKKETPKIAKQKYTIDRVIIYPDYSIQNVERGRIAIPNLSDSLEIYNDIYIIDEEKKFKPQIFDRVMHFKPNEVYNRRDHNLTLKRLINLGTFKFVKNQFILTDSINNKFDVYYLLTPNSFQSLRVEALGKTNSANFNGGELNVNWLHRNLFRGAEQLRIRAYSGMDVQVGGPKEFSNILRFGGNAQLTIPRIIAPFKTETTSEFIPRTQINLGYEYQQRTKQYTLHNFNTSFGYLWKENARKEHDLKLIDITYVKPNNVSDEYRQLVQQYPSLAKAIEQQLIFGPMYYYTYTNTIIPQKHQYYFRGGLDLSGNITGLIMGANAQENNQKKILGVPFSQFAKIDTDFRYYFNIDQKNMLATRLMLGAAYPYGNSETIPFSRQFFVGGNNSIRAFRARTLGPGSYDPRNTQGSFFHDQAGDLRLEANLEYRFKVYKFVNLAAFVDAGNIWLFNEDSSRPGAQISKDWYKEIAVGSGLGLRLDFNIFVLRTDLAIPIRVPYLEENQRWLHKHIDIKNAQWRKENLILNIAIGYPF